MENKVKKKKSNLKHEIRKCEFNALDAKKKLS